MKQVIIEHLVIYCKSPSFAQLKELEKLTGSDKIKINGKIIVVCDFQGIYKEVRKDIARIFEINPSLIYLTHSEK